MLKLLNDGYVDLRVLIYDLKPVFYIRLYTYAFELCLREQLYCGSYKENQVSFQTWKTCMQSWN